MLQQPGYVNVSTGSAPPVAVYTPRCWSEAMRIGGVPVVNTGFGPGGPGATLFLHERTTPSGVRRLVAVHAPAGTPALGTVPIPAPVVVQPATLTAAPAVRDAVATIKLDLVLQNPTGRDFTLLSGPVGVTTRFFAGRPDPANPSRFTIPFEVGPSRGEIEGFLDDGDTLRLAVKTGPADQSVASAGTRSAGASEIAGTITVDAGGTSAGGPNIGQTGKVNKAVKFGQVSIRSHDPERRAALVDPARPATRPTSGPRQSE